MMKNKKQPRTGRRRVSKPVNTQEEIKEGGVVESVKFVTPTRKQFKQLK